MLGLLYYFLAWLLFYISEHKRMLHIAVFKILSQKGDVSLKIMSYGAHISFFLMHIFLMNDLLCSTYKAE